MKTTIFVLLMALPWAWASARERVVQGISTRVVSLDPFSLSGIDDFEVTSNVLEPLARVHPRTKELIPWLAESWTIDLPAKSFRVRLREGVHFQDGSALTADDVVFTFAAYRQPEFKASVWTPMWEDIAEARKIDARTVEFRMKALHYLAFENVLTTLRILPKSFYQPHNAKKFREKILGSGPFVLKRFVPGQSLEFEPNSTWWGKEVPTFDLLVKTIPDPHFASEMMSKGQLDVYALASDVDVETFPENQLHASAAAVGTGIWIDLNLRRPLFQNQTVRHALLILWDRAKANAKLYHERYHLALDGFSPKVPYYPKGRPEGFDRARAKKLLNSCGWQDVPPTGVLKKDGKLFQFTVLASHADSDRWLTLFQQDAAAVGIQVDIKHYEETSQSWAMLKDGKFDAVAGQGGVSESVHLSTWKSDGFYNFSGYRSAEADRLLTQLDSEFDLKTRHALEKRLIARVRADYAQIPGLFSPDETFLLSARVQLDSTFPRQAWRWRLKN
jgi:peptide/nickel transport system substrate-binding protein